MLEIHETLESVIVETATPVTHSVIWMHGLGADGHDFVNLIPELNFPSNLGIRFIFPHAPVMPVTINKGMHMRAWFDIYDLTRIQREDIAGLQKSQQMIEHLIQHEINKGIPSEKIILAGFSQGGAMALYTGLRFNKKLGGILALSCYLPGMTTTAAQANSVNKQIPIFLIHGVYDQVIPFSFAELTKNFLMQLNYPVQWKDYSMGHEVCREEIKDIAQWLVKRTLHLS